MTLFKSAFSRLSHKSTPVVAANMPLNLWCHQSHQSIRFVQRVEMITALCAGGCDTWATPLGRDHHHTLLRVFLVPTATGLNTSEDTLLVERVLSTGGACHSVTPISETLSAGGSLAHPEVHDRICAIYQGSSTTLARDLVVERTLTFADRVLTLAQLAQILEFVSRTTKMVCDGGDCQFQSRSFTFTCLAAMAPTVPPRKAGGGMASDARGPEWVDDSVFELTAEAFLAQVSRLARDSESLQALALIRAYKHEPRGSVRARQLYH